jgi:hypothetical protein
MGFIDIPGIVDAITHNDRDRKKCLPKFDSSAFVHQDVFLIHIFCITFQVDS